MIVVSLGGESNKQLAALLFPDATVILEEYELDKLRDFTDKNLVLLDLDANGWFQNRRRGDMAAEAFGESLIEGGLPRDLKKVFLIISDVHQDFSLFSIGEKLSITFMKAGLEIGVYVPASLNHAISVVIPTINPDTGLLWQVYGVKGEENVTALLSTLPNEIPSKFDSAFLDKMSLDEEEHFLPYFEKFKEKIEIFSGNTESFLRWMQLPPRSSLLKKKIVLEQHDAKSTEEVVLFPQSALPDKRRSPEKVRKEPDSALEPSSSPEKKPTPPLLSPTSSSMRPRSPLSFLDQERSVDPLPSENLSVSSSSLSPHKQALLDALLKGFEGEEEQLPAILQKAIDNKKRMDQQQPRITAGGR